MKFLVTERVLNRNLRPLIEGQGPETWTPAMIWQKRASTKWNGVSILDEAERIFFKTLSPMLNFLYITLFWNALEFCGRLGHVPWREVSYHLIALIAGISKKDAPPLIHIKIFLSQAGPWWGMGMASVRTQLANNCIELQALLIRCCKLRAIKCPTKLKADIKS